MPSYTDKKFNQKEYARTYDKDHYKKFSTTIKPDIYSRIDDYCKDHKISKADFVRIAIDTLEDMER